jgi:hypothetical protein
MALGGIELARLNSMQRFDGAVAAQLPLEHDS